MDYSRFESAWLDGLTRFERGRDAFEREFIAPLGDEVMANLMAAMTPDQRLAMQAIAPDAIEAAMKKLTGGNYGKNQ